MDPKYQQIYKSAVNLEHKCADMIDDRSDALGQKLLQLAKALIDDMESKKSPRACESRVQEMQRALGRVKSDESHFMSPNDADTLEDAYEDVRRELRGLPNY